jgi:hypothetical protein
MKIHAARDEITAPKSFLKRVVDECLACHTGHLKKFAAPSFLRARIITLSRIEGSVGTSADNRHRNERYGRIHRLIRGYAQAYEAHERFSFQQQRNVGR